MPRGTQRQGRAAKVAPCHKYTWMLRRFRCGMPFDAAWPKNLIGKLSVPSKEAARHMISKRFQNGISQFEKKIRPSSPISFHSFGNLKKVCKKFFFHVDAIALAAYAEQLLPRSKAAMCCILPHGIVWTHLFIFKTCRNVAKSYFQVCKQKSESMATVSLNLIYHFANI